MAAHFHSLKIKKIVRETPECVSVEFAVPEHLQGAFAYQAGQNITIKKTIDGNELRRTYSICSSPATGILRIAIKKATGGVFSGYANGAATEGEIWEVLPPTGRFTPRPTEKRAANYLAIAAGSGITPVISIVKHTLETTADSNFTLVYGSKTKSSIIFFEELEALKNLYMQRLNIVWVLSREQTEAEINHGRIDEKKLWQLQNIIDFKNMDAAYLCGPAEMIFAAEKFLKGLGADQNKIHYELFATPGQKNIPLQKEGTGTVSGTTAVSITLDGRSMEFTVPQRGISILDAALKQGADLPFACKGGVCATCRAKLVSGEVRMDVNYALEPDEVEKGFILTCQSHPIGNRAAIDFDAK